MEKKLREDLLKIILHCEYNVPVEADEFQEGDDPIRMLTPSGVHVTVEQYYNQIQNHDSLKNLLSRAHMDKETQQKFLGSYTTKECIHRIAQYLKTNIRFLNGVEIKDKRYFVKLRKEIRSKIHMLAHNIHSGKNQTSNMIKDARDRIAELRKEYRQTFIEQKQERVV